MLTTDRLAGLVLLLFSIAVMWETRLLPLGTFRQPGPGYMPMLLAVALAAMSILVALGGAGAPPARSLDWPETRHAVAILGACAFAAVALERLGYRLTILLLLAFLLGAVERRRPALVAALALGLAFGTFFLFSNLLKVPLPRGPLGF